MYVQYGIDVHSSLITVNFPHTMFCQAGGQARLDEVSRGRAARQGVLLLGAEGVQQLPLGIR